MIEVILVMLGLWAANWAISTFVNEQTRILQKQIDRLQERVYELECKND